MFQRKKRQRVFPVRLKNDSLLSLIGTQNKKERIIKARTDQPPMNFFFSETVLPAEQIMKENAVPGKFQLPILFCQVQKQRKGGAQAEKQTPNNPCQGTKEMKDYSSDSGCDYQKQEQDR